MTAVGHGGEGVPSEADLDRHLAVGDRLDKLENRAAWLDAEFRIPGTEFRIGVSSIVGLLPGAGDGAMMLVAATIVYHGMRLGAPTRTLVWMSIVLLVEGVVSVVPIVGDAIGVLWSANLQNVGYLRAREASLDGSTNWVFVLLLASPFILFLILVGSLV
jgi:hypothetical protein